MIDVLHRDFLLGDVLTGEMIRCEDFGFFLNKAYFRAQVRLDDGRVQTVSFEADNRKWHAFDPGTRFRAVVEDPTFAEFANGDVRELTHLREIGEGRVPAVSSIRKPGEPLPLFEWQSNAHMVHVATTPSVFQKFRWAMMIAMGAFTVGTAVGAVNGAVRPVACPGPDVTLTTSMPHP